MQQGHARTGDTTRSVYRQACAGGARWLAAPRSPAVLGAFVVAAAAQPFADGAAADQHAGPVLNEHLLRAALAVDMGAVVAENVAPPQIAAPVTARAVAALHFTRKVGPRRRRHGCEYLKDAVRRAGRP